MASTPSKAIAMIGPSFMYSNRPFRTLAPYFSSMSLWDMFRPDETNKTISWGSFITLGGYSDAKNAGIYSSPRGKHDLYGKSLFDKTNFVVDTD